MLNINALFDLGWNDPGVTLPVGISFYTFTQIAFLADSYLGKVPSRPSLANYALFVTYFPHVVAGPIIHWREMILQFEAIATHVGRWKLSDEFRDRMCRGIALFAMGLAKKLLIADPLAPFVADGYRAAGLGFVDAWLTSSLIRFSCISTFPVILISPLAYRFFSAFNCH